MAQRFSLCITRQLLTIASLLLLEGCYSTETTTCSSGRVCPVGAQCAAAQDICITGNCGNKHLDPGEVCDDGNILPGDHCSADCRSDESCGNGIVDATTDYPKLHEVCDDSNNLSGDGCSADCKSLETCGNSYIDTAKGEVCDDGNNVNGDGCSADCKSAETCGNDHIDTSAGEVCDDGNIVSGDGCSSNCRSDESCGNKIIDQAKGEACDDGNHISGDNCSADCQSLETCGNNYIDAAKGEVCDDGALNGMPRQCSNDCKSTGLCGNGFWDPPVEECDYCVGLLGNVDGGVAEDSDDAKPDADSNVCPITESATCNDNCTLAKCGDGKVNHAAGENCDSKGGVDTPDCNGKMAPPLVACQAPKCGDNYVNGAPTSGLPLETCDNSNGSDVITCNGNSNLAAAAGVACKGLVCGDRYVNAAAETCDDGTGQDSAGCNGSSAPVGVACNATRCGDRYTNPISETCDSGTGQDSPSCNGNNAALGVACNQRRCGDHYVNPTIETCDDGTGQDSPSCNGSDATDGIACNRTKCGDHYTNRTSETCDDGTGGDSVTCNGSNAPLGVACNATTCGDHYINPVTETCDNGSGVDSRQCNGAKAALGIACNATTCGDLYINPIAETCDDGTGIDSDRCNGSNAPLGVACNDTTCGDRYINPAAETCDDGTGIDSESCNGNSDAARNAKVACRSPSCGDGYANRAALEQCDVLDGADSATCNGTAAGPLLRCQIRVCGDGYVNGALNNGQPIETCDDGNTISGDGCDSSCHKESGFDCTQTKPLGLSSCTPICGDGLIHGNEVCDDFNRDSCGTCSADCRSVLTQHQAEGYVVPIAGSAFNDGETLTISDGVHTPVVFEFNTETTSAPAANHVIISHGSGDAIAMARNITDAITLQGDRLDVSAYVGRSGAVILQNDNPGTMGNVAIYETVLNLGFIIGNWYNDQKAMAGGVGYDCANQLGCSKNADCLSRICCLGAPGTDSTTCPCPTGATCAVNHCLDPSFTDNILNGTETDVDCGGGAGPKCADTKVCVVNEDCQSNSCSALGQCQTPI